MPRPDAQSLRPAWVAVHWAETSRAPFVWPLEGPITNFFAPQHPLGMDIGLAASPRSSVLAMAEGRVIFAGGSACCSYGLYVVIEHKHDLTTLYAHLSRIDVQVGDEVTQSQQIGVSGNTGRSSGEHLHFEVARGEHRLDPLIFLPPPCATANPLYPKYAASRSDCSRAPNH